MSGVHIYSGASNDAELKVENNQVNVDAPLCNVNHTLTQPKFGYATLYGGQGGILHPLLFTWNCNAIGGTFATWTEDSISRIGTIGEVVGFTVLYEGFYKISAAAMSPIPESYFAILLNGVESIYSQQTGTIPGEVTGTSASAIVHLNANTAVQVRSVFLGGFFIQGSYLNIERMNGQSANVKFLQLGVTSTFSNM